MFCVCSGEGPKVDEKLGATTLTTPEHDDVRGVVQLDKSVTDKPLKEKGEFTFKVVRKASITGHTPSLLQRQNVAQVHFYV